mmetsp:Transcript_72087/g.145010  ORF Transcript_72087/g.145010 Transcript_72087/m.145010 type:complete len:133 (-) Transcript_72087:572-970(-)
MVKPAASMAKGAAGGYRNPLAPPNNPPVKRSGAVKFTWPCKRTLGTRARSAATSSFSSFTTRSEAEAVRVVGGKEGSAELDGESDGEGVCSGVGKGDDGAGDGGNEGAMVGLGEGAGEGEGDGSGVAEAMRT